MSRPTLSVVIPAFNSERHIEARIALLQMALQRMGLHFELIVVDDGSTDATWSTIARLDVRRIRLEHNLGKFGAIKAGMREAAGSCCTFTDSDVPFDPEVFERMIALTLDQGFHVVVGDRTLPGSVYRSEMVLGRRIATAAFRHTVRLLVTGELPDTQCGVKGFRHDVAKALFPLVQANRYAGDVELLYIALKHDLSIRRVPVRLINSGSSSLGFVRDGAEMLSQIARFRRRYRRGEYESPELQSIAGYTNFV